MQKLLHSFPIIAIGLFAVVHPVLAVPTDYLGQLAGDLGLPRYDSFTAFLTDFLSVLLALVFIIAVLFAVISGYRMVTSGGNEEILEKARRSLTWSIAGAAVVLLAWIIVRAVLNLLEKGSKGV